MRIKRHLPQREPWDWELYKPGRESVDIFRFCTTKENKLRNPNTANSADAFP